MNNHLAKLEEDLLKDLTEAEKQITDETHELLVSLDEKQKKLSEYQTNIINIEKYASDLQTFLAVVYFFFGQKTSDKALIQQLLRQTFECWW
jgi:septal ring factor EnvC (AmiA/AmiB activator)